MNDNKPLHYGAIFLFWIPLALMWLMMAVEQPVLNSVIARLSNAELNLAAFGVMWTLAVLIESPILQMLSAGTRLGGTLADIRQLIKLMNLLALGITLIHLLITLTPLLDLITLRLLNVPPHIASRVRPLLLMVTPFPACVGYRRVFQGILIRQGRTGVIPVIMIGRLIVTIGILLVGLYLDCANGAALAAAAIMIGIVVAAVMTWGFYRRQVLPGLKAAETAATEPGDETEGSEDVRPVQTLHAIIRFYIPLSMTSIVYMFAQPLVTMGITRSLLPARNLAVWPVVNSFLFLLNAFGLSFQEVVVALAPRESPNGHLLRNFLLMIAAVQVLVMIPVAFTPLSELWFSGIAGLQADLLPYTRIPLRIMVVLPSLLGIKAWLRGTFIHCGKTGVLARSITLYTLMLLLLVLLLPGIWRTQGSIFAAAAIMIAHFGETAYLEIVRLRNRRAECGIPAPAG